MPSKVRPSSGNSKTRQEPTSRLSFVPFLLISSVLVVTLAILSLRALPRLSLLSNHFFPLTTTTTLFSSPSSSSSTKRNSQRTMSAYAKELEVAQLAVQRASILTKRVFHEKAKGTVDKNDKSPVTIGDFGAQALIIAALRHHFPDDEIVAEEEAAQLRSEPQLRDQIWDLVKTTQLDDAAAEASLGGSIASAESMMDIIDQGNSKGGAAGRIWAIDPIDGTKGFLRGGQYAVCLALMVDGDVKGATSRPLRTGAIASGSPISMKPVTDLSAATFCESVEAGHSAHDDQAQIAAKLGITKPSVRMDSQSKYGSIARGAGDIYLRLPVKATYQEKIWDHAAGDLIVREAGGQVTDIQGKRLDFAVGRTLANNKGVIAAPAAVHGEVLKVVQEVLSSKSS
ncbi:3',5'-bisphosphate nucleotidase [Colletotrichum scovillei]|uniref:3',5'-bisphosphate nucleotidase n=1 Tax=Colletotrichum scovillei TaxID=1209932 RepID=UPI0015C2F018|nr:3',5'-bisphosphate nucleotidase [Colletotrichum scovillei]KAF4781215.1 3',5'-bisphosphate nucleotidase [Colletotrichum scovillei]